MLPFSLYEHPVWQSVPEQVMRPGGLTVTEQALAYCDLQSGMRVLDVGCGTGATLGYVTAKYGYAVLAWMSQRGLLTRRGRPIRMPGGCVRKGKSLPFASESMDAEFYPNPLSILMKHWLSECARTFKHGGWLYRHRFACNEMGGLKRFRQLPSGTCITAAMPKNDILEKIESCGLQVSIWQDCSETLKEFSICTLTTAAKIDPFDLHIAAAKAKLGYYFW
ncbi:MAG: methyltransferase domain-containing protein [Anaerolineales bacterium]|nr:methyltransferase domain-containing protein [Anaerolineales bacterium]